MVRSLVLLFLCTIYVYGLPQRSLLGGHAGCVKPGLCVAPNTTYKAVSSGPTPGIQWEISGGFCGSWSIQQAALAHGAWISQDLIRKANIDWVGPKVMHGDPDLGYEILPINVGFTAGHLKLRYEEWDYNTTKPQAAAYKAWIKKHLLAGSPIVWFPMCKGDHGDGCYGGAGCPNGGNLDHVEPMYGIFSNHPLNDSAVYEDDWILHASDQDRQPYFRRLAQLDDSPAMDGNCKDAQAFPGRNEMFPCFDQSVTYGMAVQGLAVDGTVPTALIVNDVNDEPVDEPNVRTGHKSIKLQATLHIQGLVSGATYTVFRYNSVESLPRSPPFTGAERSMDFVATGIEWWWLDPSYFDSHSAVYYIVAPKTSTV